MDNLSDFADWLSDKIDSLYILSGELLTETLDFILEIFSIVLDWLYGFLFDDLWCECQHQGSLLFEFFFGEFCNKSFTFESIEYVVGFIFIVFALKFTINLIRG